MREALKTIKRKTWKEQWNIAVAEVGYEKFLAGGIDNVKLNWLFKERKDGFCADPFIIEDGNRTFVFFEEFDYESEKGVISCSEITKVNSKIIASKPVTILEEPHHLSYPFVFQKDSEWFMVPESSAIEEIIVYRAIDFPYHWEKRKVLIEHLPALDSTIIEQNGLMWLFCTRIDKGENSALCAYYSDSLFGKWKPHLQNPIKTDLSAARPAGKMFVLNEKLYRPSQNSIGTYGKSITLNKITKLTSDAFEEIKIGEIKPQTLSSYKQGIHTFNFSRKYVVIDGKRFSGLKKYLDPVYSRYFKKQ